MKLSEAIRLGARMRPQAFGGFNRDGGTCAIGAAREACGEYVSPDLFPFIAVEAIACPSCGLQFRTTSTEHGARLVNAGGAVIVHLNDDHRWTREAISDWVEGIEHAHEAADGNQQSAAEHVVAAVGALAQKGSR